jgi:hypothetical protein
MRVGIPRDIENEDENEATARERSEVGDKAEGWGPDCGPKSAWETEQLDPTIRRGRSERAVSFVAAERAARPVGRRGGETMTFSCCPGERIGIASMAVTLLAK